MEYNVLEVVIYISKLVLNIENKNCQSTSAYNTVGVKVVTLGYTTS